MEAYTSQGLPAPQFLQEMGQFIVRMLPTPSPFDQPARTPEIDLSGLNERQRKAVEYVRQHGSITIPQYLTLVDVTDRQARTDLRKLIERGILASQGKGRSTRYVPAS